MTPWPEVIAELQDIAARMSEQPLTNEGAAEVIRLANVAIDLLEAFRFADDPLTIVGQEWRDGYRLHVNACDAWFRRYRAVVREQEIEYLRSDSVVAAERACVAGAFL